MSADPFAALDALPLERVPATIARLSARLLTAPAAAANYLWEVSSLTNRVYLFGTVHAGKASWYPPPRAVVPPRP